MERIDETSESYPWSSSKWTREAFRCLWGVICDDDVEEVVGEMLDDEQSVVVERRCREKGFRRESTLRLLLLLLELDVVDEVEDMEAEVALRV